MPVEKTHQVLDVVTFSLAFDAKAREIRYIVSILMLVIAVPWYYLSKWILVPAVLSYKPSSSKATWF